MRLWESPFSGVESTPLPTETQPRNVGGHTCESGAPSGGCRLPCDLQCSPGLGVEGASWSSQRDRPPRDITGLGCWQMPLSRRIIGLVSLLQRCRRARASAGTLDITHGTDSDANHAGFASHDEDYIGLPQSYSFLDLTGAHRGPPYAQYGHSRHIMGLYEQQARRRTMPHNVTPDLARSSRKVSDESPTRVSPSLGCCLHQKTHELTVKIAGLRSVLAAT
jgi:hypothetical protein